MKKSLTPRIVALCLSIALSQWRISPSYPLRGLNLHEDPTRQQDLKAGLEGGRIVELVDAILNAPEGAKDITSDELMPVLFQLSIEKPGASIVTVDTLLLRTDSAGKEWRLGSLGDWHPKGDLAEQARIGGQFGERFQEILEKKAGINVGPFEPQGWKVDETRGTYQIIDMYENYAIFEQVIRNFEGLHLPGKTRAPHPLYGPTAWFFSVQWKETESIIRIEKFPRHPPVFPKRYQVGQQFDFKSPVAESPLPLPFEHAPPFLMRVDWVEPFPGQNFYVIRVNQSEADIETSKVGSLPEVFTDDPNLNSGSIVWVTQADFSYKSHSRGMISRLLGGTSGMSVSFNGATVSIQPSRQVGAIALWPLLPRESERESETEAPSAGLETGQGEPPAADRSAAGLESEAVLQWERHVQEVKRSVRHQVNVALNRGWARIPFGFFIPVDFDLGVYRAGVFHPEWALVRGGGSGWWIHLHLAGYGTDNGLLIRLLLSKRREPRIIGLTDIFAEREGVPVGFVPLDGLVPPHRLGWLRNTAWRTVRARAGILEKTIGRNRPKSVLGVSIIPAGSTSLMYAMLNLKQLGAKQRWRFAQHGEEYQRVDPREVVVKDLVVEEAAALPSGRIEIAGHENLLVPLQERSFNDLPIKWLPVSTDREKAREELKDFTVQDQVQRFAILDEMFLTKAQAMALLPDRHAPVFLTNFPTAQRLTPAVAALILDLHQRKRLPAGSLLLLELRRDDSGQLLLSISA